MKNTVSLIFSSVVIIATLLSCGGGQKKSFEKNFAAVTGDDAHSFRNVNLGDGYMDVMKNENPDFLEYQDSTMIRYTIHYTDSEEYKFAYLFTADKLSEIQFDAYLGQISDGEKMSALLKKRFDKKYGPMLEEQGFLTWNKEGVSIELLDESELFGYGKVHLLIFNTPSTPRPRPLPLEL